MDQREAPRDEISISGDMLSRRIIQGMIARELEDRRCADFDHMNRVGAWERKRDRLIKSGFFCRHEAEMREEIKYIDSSHRQGVMDHYVKMGFLDRIRRETDERLFRDQIAVVDLSSARGAATDPEPRREVMDQ